MQQPCCAPTGHGAHPSVQSRTERELRWPSPAPVRRTAGQVLIHGHTFQMGDCFDEGTPSDGETPLHHVELADFYLDATTVTNAEFAAFVNATGYVTEAESLGVSAVFHLAFRGNPEDVVNRVAEAPWWLAVRGANWIQPDGPGSNLDGRLEHPVVHVTWNDAAAYAAWAGKRLPTEAEWEFAARGGIDGARFPWGDALKPQGEWLCNIWQGDFPARNTTNDGFLTTAPASSFPPNGFGLYQMVGNVWEWCADWFDPGYYAVSPSKDPKGPPTGAARVMRGGSYLCHDSYCYRYRAAARSCNTPDSASANMSFRCANSVGTEP